MAIPGDSRFGQWADPNFGATLSHSTTNPVLPAPTSPTESPNMSASDNGGVINDAGDARYTDYSSYLQHNGGSDTTRLKNGSFSLGTRPWGEDEIDPLTGKLGWQETYRDQIANTMMADGGVVPGEDQEQDSGNAAPPPTDPFALISSALSYGRQKFQMPSKLYGEPAEPITGYAEGGEVEDDQGDQGMIPDGPDQAQAQSQGPQMNPQAAMAYLQGAGAAPPDVAAALERRVDPRNEMDPTERRMAAVTAAGTPDRAFSVMQHYRQKFNKYSAFADAALRGAGGRPPNVEAAADALNKAYSYVPDGSSVHFTPTKGGMHVSSKTIPSKPAGPGGDQPNPNPFPTKDGGFGRRMAMNDGDEDDQPQTFADGGEVEDEYQPDLMPNNGQNVLPEQADAAPEQGVLPDQEGNQEPVSLAEFVSGAARKQDLEDPEVQRRLRDLNSVGDAVKGAVGQVGEQVARTPAAVKNYFVRLGNLFGLGQKVGFDATMDKGGFDAAAVEHLTPTDLGPSMDTGSKAAPMTDAEGKETGNAASERMMRDPYNQGMSPEQQQAMARQNPAGFGAKMGSEAAANAKEGGDDNNDLVARMQAEYDQGLKDIDTAFGGWASTQRERLIAKANYRQQFIKEVASVAAGRDRNAAAMDRAQVMSRSKEKIAEGNNDTKKAVVQTQQEHGDQRADKKFTTQREIADANRASKESEGEKNRSAAAGRTIVTQDPRAAQDAERFRKAQGNMGFNNQAPQQQQPAPQQQGQQFQPAPAAGQRQAGVTYMTPKGPLTWTGTGWLQPSR